MKETSLEEIHSGLIEWELAVYEKKHWSDFIEEKFAIRKYAIAIDYPNFPEAILLDKLDLLFGN